MKYYVFITFSVVGVGGGQLYIRNKVSYLKQKGWNVIVYSANYGEVLIKQLSEYKHYIIRDLGFLPNVIPQIRRDRIISRMTKELCGGEIVVESNSTIFGLWGELLARHCNATHLLFSLEESNPVLSPSHLEFLTYKWNQHALAGITAKSLITMFHNNGIEIPEGQSYSLLAHCTNSVEDVDFNLKLEQADYTICVFGRLEKPFVKETIKAVSSYISKHKDVVYNVIVVGGGGESLVQEISEYFTGLPNCQLYMTGYLFPVPYKLLQGVDIAISSAGSCSIFRRFGVITVSIDGKDLKPIGFYGITTKNSLFRAPEEPEQELESLLDRCLVHKEYVTNVAPYKDIIYDFDSHLDFVSKIHPAHKYFDILKIHIGWKEKSVDRIKLLWSKILRSRLYVKLSDFIK